MVLLRSKWLHLYQIESFVCRTDFQFVLKWLTSLTTFYTVFNTLAKLPALYKTLGVRPETSAKRPATAVEEYSENEMSNTNRCHSNSFHIRHSRRAAKYSLKGKKEAHLFSNGEGKKTFTGTNSVSVGKYSPQWSEYKISIDEPVSVSWLSSCRLRAFPSLWRSPSHKSKKICRKKLTSMPCRCSRNELHRRQFVFLGLVRQTSLERRTSRNLLHIRIQSSKSGNIQTFQKTPVTDGPSPPIGPFTTLCSTDKWTLGIKFYLPTPFQGTAV